MGARSTAVATALVFVGTLALQLAWLLSVAPFAGIDEIDHAFRASSVGEGHVLPSGRPVPTDRGRGDLIVVRSDVVAAAAPACRRLKYNGPDNCTPVDRTGRDTVLIGSAAARYDPVFYVATGLAARSFDGVGAVYAMRAASALLCAVLVAAIAWMMIRRSRTTWPLALLVAALTPTTLFSTTLTSPNGLNIVSGLALWTGLAGLLVHPHPPEPRQRRGLLVLATVGGSLLACTHTLGIVWLALSVVVVLVGVGPRTVRARVVQDTRGYLVSAAVVTVVWVAAVAWVLLVHVNDPSSEPARSGAPSAALGAALLLGVILWPLQAIAAFPSREDSALPVVYAIGLFSLLGVVALGWVSARAAMRRVLVLVLVLFFAVPLALTVVTYQQLGAAWQGRYGLPLAIGIGMLLATAIDAGGPGWSRRRWLPTGLVVLSVIEQFYSWRSTVGRLDAVPFWHDDPAWHQPGVGLLVALAVVAALTWGGACLVAQRGRSEAELEPGPVTP